MERKILKVIYGLIVLGFTAGVAAFAWFIFSSAIPNTTEANNGFREMTGLQPNQVADIYYDASYDFHGDYSKYLRFTYASDEWLNRFLSSRTNFLPLPSAALRARRVWPWWDNDRLSQLSEFYGHYSGQMPYGGMAIDRQNRHVYLYQYTY